MNELLLTDVNIVILKIKNTSFCKNKKLMIKNSEIYLLRRLI